MSELVTSQLRGDYREQEPIARYTSWRVGGPVKRFYKPKDLPDLQYFLSCLPSDENIIWLGLGSNVLMPDQGLDATVILTQGVFTELTLTEEGIVKAEAGLSCAKVARFCAKNSFGGSEFLAGIPGTMGGALAMNAGAFGGETWDIVSQVDMLNREGKIIRRDKAEFVVRYREVQKPCEEWFLAAYFSPLAKQAPEEGLAQIKALLNKRSSSQPTGLPSGGSVFRNPEGDYAARLIEQCGLKGMRIGGAEVSTKHANFIVHHGEATAEDILALISEVAKIVKAETGVALQREVHIL